MASVDIVNFIIANLGPAIIGGLVGLLIQFFANNGISISIYLFKQPGLKRRINGTWNNYHLTSEKAKNARPFWSHHKDVLRLTPTLSIRGKSQVSVGGETYNITGRVRNSEVRLQIENPDISSDNAFVLIPNILSSGPLRGIVLANDYDLDAYASPIIMSRDELSDEQLDEIIANHYPVNFITDRSVPEKY